jgi:hypothetical protein
MRKNSVVPDRPQMAVLQHVVCCITKAINVRTRLSVTFYVFCLSCFFITRHSVLHLCSHKETEEGSDHDISMTVSHYRTSIGSGEGQ